MSAPHTAGPFTVQILPVLSRILASMELTRLVNGTQEFSGALPMVVAANGLCVAVTGCGPDGIKNANFFAAAPVMFKTLSDLDGWLASTGHDSEHPWRLAIRGAVAMAEGGDLLPADIQAQAAAVGAALDSDSIEQGEPS